MINDPIKIENESFRIITEELTMMNIKINTENEDIIKRIIHTTADFEYANITVIHKDAVKKGMAAIKKGCRIYADTNMICAGVNKKLLDKYNCEIYSLVGDNEVREDSQKTGLTRSSIAIEKACKDDKTKIFVIGNAPTALFKLKELVDAGSVKPELIIGVPVGFVGAVESKESIKGTYVPYIVTNGRKGGSTVAVSILNALLYKMNKYK